MMRFFIKYNGISLVTSRRKVIDDHGRLVRFAPDKKLYRKDRIVNGSELSKMILRNQNNYIGEPTTALFRRDDLKGPFGTFCGKQAYNNVDVASWLTLLPKRKAVYLSEPLSSFRIHSSQISNSTPSKMARLCDWIDHIMYSRKKGILKDVDFVESVKNLRKPILSHFPEWNENTDNQYINILIKRMRKLVRMSKQNKSLSDITREFESLLMDLKSRK
jgi:hypothetical protein